MLTRLLRIEDEQPRKKKRAFLVTRDGSHLPSCMVPLSSRGVSTVSTRIKRWGCIFQNGFLGGLLFEFDLPGVVFKLGLYLLRNTDFKPRAI